jgi:chromosome segregation ATPase
MNADETPGRETIADSLESIQQLTRTAWLSILLMLVGGAVVLVSFVYSVTRLRPLEEQVRQRQIEVRTLDIALRESEGQLEAARQERDFVNKQTDGLKKDIAQLEAIKATLEASIAGIKERAAQEPPKPEEIKAAEEPATTAEKREIVDLVAKLFSKRGAERTAAYDALTQSLRTKDYAAEKILERGQAELSKSAEQRDFVGIYNTIVTLTDMSRAVTQKPEFKDRITSYADQAAEAFPKLANRVELLKKWLNSKRQ